ncbi:MAG: histidine kinase [Clostridia bacterium]|nr:histidine kinase [Clostridia bacterium]
MMNFKENIFRNIRNYKAHSIFVKCFVLEIILTLLPFLIVSGFYYGNVKKSAWDQMILENEFLIYEVRDITDTILNECDMLCTYIANTDAVQMFMVNDWFSEKEAGSYFEVDDLLKGIPLIYGYIDSVYVYSEYNSRIYNAGRWSSAAEFRDKGWLEDYKKTDNQYGRVLARVKNNNYPYLITVIKPVIIDKEKKGAIVFNINSSQLYKSVSSTSLDSLPTIYLTDNDGKVLMSGTDSDFSVNISELYPDIGSENLSVSELKNSAGDEFLVSVIDSGRYGLKYVNATPMEEYAGKISRMLLQIVLILFGLLILSLIFALCVSVVVYKPVDEIIAVIDDPESFDFANVRQQNELKYIVSNILSHVRANNEMKEELERRLGLLKQSQIGMLQAQITPHFLYNTLETINWMAVDAAGGADNEVSCAVTSLARLLRDTVSSSDYLVSIDKEIEYTNNYIDILELRYGDMFDVDWDIESGMGKYSVVKICLQPVIENAVYHGLKPKGRDGLLTIRGKLFDEYILFEIEDNGVGMEPWQTEQINDRLHARDYINDKHIGLYNVSRRIRIIYGDEYGLYVTSEKGKGTCVGMTFPKLVIE